MKVPINLASRPFENLRPLYFAATIALAAFVTMSLLVVWNVQQHRNETSSLTEESSKLDRSLRELKREQEESERWLARPEVQKIREQSEFLNSIILRKSLSWTQIFVDLEKILPEQVQVVTIRPSVNQSQQAELNLAVSAPTVQSLVTLLKVLESSPRFGNPVVDAQGFPSERAKDQNFTLDLSVLYHQAEPGPATSDAATNEMAAGERPAVEANRPAAGERTGDPAALPGILPGKTAADSGATMRESPVARVRKDVR